MTDTKLIKKIKMHCPLCNKNHDLELREGKSMINIKGEEIIYTKLYYYCPEGLYGDHEFTFGKMADQNLMNARNSYRLKKGLLTSYEIVDIRQMYSLTQVELSKLMGWGESTISRYESKSIQDESYDTMLRIIRDDPNQALDFLQKNIENFSEIRANEIRNIILRKIEIYGREYISRQNLKSHYAKYSHKSDLNGYTILDIDKIEAMTSYIAERVENLYTVKLMKMLWFSDAKAYISRNASITGLVYSHKSFGALPIGYRALMSLENINSVEEIGYENNMMTHIFPKQGMDYSALSKEDIEILNQVIAKFKNYSSKEISEYMHQEEAYIDTDHNELIPFSLAAKIRDF